jgi:ABC-type sugar transport system ATPase subunit
VPIDVEIRAGELVGLAGLEGHGQDQFLAALWGLSAAHGTVARHIDGRQVEITSTHDATAYDIAYVPRERRAESLFEWMSIRDNFALPTLRRDTRLGLMRTQATDRRLQPYRDRLNIKLGNARDAIATLSGGNQQKIVMARWLATDPKVLLLNDPTRGIDIGAKRDLYALIAELSAEGLAVVMLSTEVDEHVELMDRVLVFRQNTLSAEIDRASLTRDRIIASFFGENVDV